MEKTWKKLIQPHQQKLLSISMQDMLVLADMEWNGLLFDEEKSKEKAKETELESDLVIIRLVEDENQGQQIIIETASTIDVWESPTSSLLTEY